MLDTGCGHMWLCERREPNIFHTETVLRESTRTKQSKQLPVRRKFGMRKLFGVM